jgi:DNA-binding MarR family transcriptional regulator
MLAHQSSVSVVVARLVEKGLVSRTRSKLDGRQVQLALTAKGRKLHRELPAVAQVKLLAVIEGLPARERRALATGLRALARAMGASTEQPAPLFFEANGVTRAARRKQEKPSAAR